MPVSTVVPLGPFHVTALRELLARDTAENMYLLGVLEEFGIVSGPNRVPFEFWGRFVNGELQAALFVGGDGGLLVPSSAPLRDIADIAKHLAGKVNPKSLLGEKGLVDSLLSHLAPSLPVRHSRSQRLWSVSADDLGPFTNPLLRLATEADLPQVVPMAAAFVREVMQRDALEEDPDGFPARVRQRVVAQRTYVLEDQQRLVFKIDVGSRSQFGAELEGIYTIPEARKHGHATLCLGQISRFLLSSLPKLTLRFDEDNTSLASAARKVGFLAKKQQRFACLE
jgi:hypothetical protein